MACRSKHASRTLCLIGGSRHPPGSHPFSRGSATPIGKASGCSDHYWPKSSTASISRALIEANSSSETTGLLIVTLRSDAWRRSVQLVSFSPPGPYGIPARSRKHAGGVSGTYWDRFLLRPNSGKDLLDPRCQIDRWSRSSAKASCHCVRSTRSPVSSRT